MKIQNSAFRNPDHIQLYKFKPWSILVTMQFYLLTASGTAARGIIFLKR